MTEAPTRPNSSETSETATAAPVLTGPDDSEPEAPPAATSPTVDNPLPDDRYLNRELSWLDFNARVLALSADPSLPLLERAKFLAIFASNLDEFYMVRVAGLKRRDEMGYRSGLLTGCRHASNYAGSANVTSRSPAAMPTCSSTRLGPRWPTRASA